MACWRPTPSCAVKSFPLRQSAPPRPQARTLTRRARRRASAGRDCLKRVFDIDVEHCPNCGGALKIIACPEARRRAAIEDPPVIDKILGHLGLPTRALGMPRRGTAHKRGQPGTAIKW